MPSALHSPNEKSIDDQGSVPLPIQSFLWRQTNPFLGAKVGKLHEASCVTLERVVVQNLLHGLSPSLSDAIVSVPRWTVIKAAFPHVIQCGSSLLNDLGPPKEKEDEQRMSTSLAKILYILHWMLLDSANECNDNDPTSAENDGANGLSTYVLPLSSVQLFAYSICPLVHNLTELDVANHIRLESGINIWRALWNYEQPDLICFRAPVKPKKSQLLYVPLLRKSVNTAGADIFMGGQADASGIYLGDPGPSPPIITAPGRAIMPNSKYFPVPLPSSKPISSKPSLRLPKNGASVAPHTSPVPEETDRPDPVQISPDESPSLSRGVVRSVSDYKKEERGKMSQSMKETSNKLPEHKAVVKSATVALPSRHFEELEKQLKYVEESSVAGVEINDRAPLVMLQDICAYSIDADSIGQNSAVLSNVCGSKYEVVCDGCHTVLFREGVVIANCRCSPAKTADRRRSSQLRIVPVALPEETESLDSEDRKLSATEGEKSSLLEHASVISPPISSFSCTSSILGSSPPRSKALLSDGSNKQIDTCGTMDGVSQSLSDDTKIDAKVLKAMNDMQFPPEMSKKSKPSGEGIGQAISAIAPGVYLGAAGRPFDHMKALSGIGEQHSGMTPEMPSISQVLGSDKCQASYFDVAVLRCLFVKNWPEPGVHWGLKYMYNRLLEISSELASKSRRPFRQRSNSMPVSQVRINVVRALSPVQSKTDMENWDGRPPITWNDLQPFAMSSNNSSFKSRLSFACTEDSPPPISKNKVAFFVEDETLDPVAESDDRRKADEAQALLKPSEPQPSKLMDRRKSLTSFTKLFTGSSVKPVGDSQADLTVEGTSPAKMGLMRKLSGARAQTPIVQIPAISTTTAPSNGVHFPGRAPRPMHQHHNYPMSGTTSPDHSLIMSRSITDSNISYVAEFMTEAVGSTPFIHRNGHLRVWRVLEAVVFLLSQPASLRICETSLNIIDILIENDIQSPENELGVQINRRKSPGTKKVLTAKSSKTSLGQKSLKTSHTQNDDRKDETKRTKKSDILKLFIDALTQIFLSLGCAYGCNDKTRSIQADFLRTQARNCMWRVQVTAPKLFVRRMQQFIDKEDLSKSLDLLHAITAFCHDSSVQSTGHRLRAHSHISQDSRSSRGRHTPDMQAPSYKNHFNSAMKGIEGATIQAVIEPLVTKMSNQMQQLHQPENTGLYHDVRCLMSLVQEQHGHPFRMVVLSALKDTMMSLTPPTLINIHSSNEELDSKSTASTEDSDGSSRGSPSTLPVISSSKERPSLRRGMFKKNKPDDSDVDSNSPGTPRNRHSSGEGGAMASSSSPLLPSGGRKKPGKLQMAWSGLFKSNKSDNQTLSENDALDISDSEVAQGSIEEVESGDNEGGGTSERGKKAKISFKSVARGITAVGSFSKKHRNRDQESEDIEDSKLPERGLFDDLIIPQKQLVNLKSLREGVQRFSFVLETCKPGSVPDSPLLGALLTLRSPVLSRAALLAEMCYFVHRCNKGQWPEWIRLGATSGRTTGHALGNRGTPSGLRRAHMLQRSAGHIMHQWAEVIGMRLEQLLEEDKLDADALVKLPINEANKRQLRVDDDLEDFLDESIVNNETQTACPMALRMIAVMLLLEITAFLRETFQHLPRTKGAKWSTHETKTFYLFEENAKNLHPGWEKLMSHRRWSVLSNTFNPLSQNSGSAQSITDLPNLHPSLGERRLSFHTPDEESPHSSEGALDELATENDKKIEIAGGSQPTVFRPVSRPSTVPKPVPKLGKMGRGVSLDTPNNPFPPTSILKRKPSFHSGSSLSILQEGNPQCWVSLDTSDMLCINDTSGSVSSDVKRNSRAQLGSSGKSSTLTIGSMQKALEGPIRIFAESARKLAQGRTKLLKQGGATGSGSLHRGTSMRGRRTSIKLKKKPTTGIDPAEVSNSAVNDEGPSSRRQSVKSRKGSNLSNMGDDVETGLVEQLGVVQPDRGSVERSSKQGPELSHPHAAAASQPSGHDAQAEAEDMLLIKNMPWQKTVVRFANTFNFVCNHQKYCHPYCFERIARQSHRLNVALRKVHGEEFPLEDILDRRKAIIESLHDKLNRSLTERRRTSAMPVPRRESALTRSNFERTNAKLNEILMEKIESEKKEQKHTSKKLVSPEDEITVPDCPPKYVEETGILKYIKTQIGSAVHCTLSTLLKSACILTENQYLDTMPVAWEMMLQSDHHTVSCAAATFIMCSVRQPEPAIDLIRKELGAAEPAQRIAAILRFLCLWRNRYHVWLKMEEGAHALFKVPPPGIDFTLPSPPIGQSQMGVVDPPWMPHYKTKVQELTLKEQQDSTSQTIMTMTKTRRKQKQELVKRAIEQAEERKSAARQEFQLLATAVPQQAAYEPALFYHAQAQASAANESEEEGETTAVVPRYHVPVAQPLFPSCLLSIVPRLIELLDDSEVDADGNSVGETAKRIVWSCLVEDSSLFLRHFLEKLTNREKQHFHISPEKEYLMGLLRKLILNLGNLPSQTAYSLFNYLIGFVMYYVRAPCEGSQFAMAMALSLTWMIVPNVRSVYFKDMKQTLKKEQCDAAVMVMANVPSAKKIVVHGPEVGSIPSQFPILEDTQFHQILTDSIEFFNIPTEEVNNYFLVDTKSGILHNPMSYVRDFYYFRRSFYPQLNLVHMDPVEAIQKMKKIAFTLKFVDLGKTLLSCSILKHAPPQLVPQRVFFLHDEFTKLQAFPRKALEACFGMYRGEMGAELHAMDTMHKYAWVQLMSTMFLGMENPFMFGDLHLFINVVNGVMIMHCEDATILRVCMATYINIAHHFSSLFSTHGFLLIMPTILRCYSQRRTNLLLKRVTEFVCKQFYILHRKPFILQMFGSAASILDLNDCETEFDPMLIKGSHLFELISALEELDSMIDKLNILPLVNAQLPLKALDLCYKDDPNTFCLLTDALASCVTICATAQESRRCHQMMTIMGALLPHYLQKIQEKTKSNGSDQASLKYELQVYVTLSVAMKALINCQDLLSRPFSGPQRSFDVVNIGARGKSLAPDSPQMEMHEESLTLPPVVLRNDSRKPPPNVPWENPTGTDSMEVQREIFRKPRDALLQVCANYLRAAQPRLQELSTKLQSDHYKIPELLDHKSHLRLSEVALALLKLAPYDSNTMGCLGLQKYFLDILPVTDWSVEHYRSALNVILRRLDKTFTKIGKKGGVRRRANWDALSNWLKGLYDTLSLFPYMAHLHSLKTMMAMCLKIISGDPSLVGGGDESLSSVAHHSAPQTVLTPGTPAQNFCSAVLKLTSFMMQALGEQQLSIEYVLSSEMLGWASERIEAVLCHFLMPLILRAATTRKDAPILRKADLQHIITVLLNAVHPATPKQNTLGPQSSTATSVPHQSSGRQGSVSMAERSHCATVSTPKIVRDSVYQSVFLALRMIIVIFDTKLSSEWPRISRTLRELAVKKAGGSSLWNFIDFASSSNSPLGLMLQPLVQHKLIWAKPGSETEAIWQDSVKDRHIELHICNSTSLQHMTGELKAMRDDFCHRTLDASRTPTLLPEVGSESSSAHSGDRRQSGSSRRASDSRRFSLIASASKAARLSPGFGGKPQVLSPQESVQSPGIEDSTIVEEGEGEGGTVSASTPDDFGSQTRLTRHRSTIRLGSSRRWRGRESNSLKGRLTRTLNQPESSWSVEQISAPPEQIQMQTLVDTTTPKAHATGIGAWIGKKARRPSLSMTKQGHSLDVSTKLSPTDSPSVRDRVVSFGHTPRRKGAVRERTGSIDPARVELETNVDHQTKPPAGRTPSMV